MLRGKFHSRRKVMSRVLLLIGMMLGLVIPAAAQNADEIAALRKQLGLPESIAIAPAAKIAFPAERLRTVYIFTGDQSAITEVQKLAQEINKKQADSVAIVQESAKASVWLIQYEVPGTRRKD